MDFPSAPRAIALGSQEVSDLGVAEHSQGRARIVGRFPSFVLSLSWPQFIRVVLRKNSVPNERAIAVTCLLKVGLSARRQEMCLRSLIVIVLAVVRDLIRIRFRTRVEIIAENLFLRRQLALYQERKARRRRPTP